MSDKPTGPFSVFKNEHGELFLQYEDETGYERYSKWLPLPTSYLIYLVEWVNELWAEREGDE